MATTMRVSWPANPASEYISKYEVLRSLNGDPFQTIGFVNAPATSLDIANPLGIYAFKVKAYNVAGVSVESDVANGPGVPSKPGTPTVEVITS